MHIERRKVAFVFDQVIDRNISKQRIEAFLAVQNDRSSLLLDEQRITHELDSVAKALLRVQEDCFSAQRVSVPDGLFKTPRAVFLEFSSPLIVQPAVFKIALEKIQLRPVAMCLREIGFQFERFCIALGCFI